MTFHFCALGVGDVALVDLAAGAAFVVRMFGEPGVELFDLGAQGGDLFVFASHPVGLFAALVQLLVFGQHALDGCFQFMHFLLKVRPGTAPSL